MQERNESLFYYVLSNNIEELLPIVHMPTVSLYCQKYGLMFKSLPRSLFISIKDKGARRRTSTFPSIHVSRNKQSMRVRAMHPLGPALPGRIDKLL